MTIRKMREEEIPLLATIWLDVSISAHHFIAPHYWEKNKLKMIENYLPNSEVFVAEIENEVVGFIALVNDYLAALFVAEKQQEKGLGRALLEFAKASRTQLLLRVYQKNKKLHMCFSFLCISLKCWLKLILQKAKLEKNQETQKTILIEKVKNFLETPKDQKDKMEECLKLIDILIKNIEISKSNIESLEQSKKLLLKDYK